MKMNPGRPPISENRPRKRLRRWLGARTRPARRRLGLIPRPHDRYILEEVIFPELRSRPDVRTILFVGCDAYTEHYPDLFDDRDFITLDIDPSKEQYGARRHITDSLLNVESHVPSKSLDAVICNGVFGWGLNEAADIDGAAAACFRSLRVNGIFIVGWDDVAPWRPPPLDDLEAFRLFSPFVLPPFSQPVYPTFTDLRHVYSFYRRPSDADS